jgi:aldehyde dehydrogenase
LAGITAGLAFLGVSLFVAILGLAATAIVERRVTLFSRSSRMRQRVDGLRGHFIVCAYGRVGRAIARELEAAGVPFVVVDSKAELESDIELIADLVPAGVVNIVNGFGVEAGKPLASSPRVAKVAFTGETTTGRLIMQYASQNIRPVTLELGGKSPNIFLEDVARSRDEFYDKTLEGFTMFALNQGEVCTCPSRALIQDSIYDQFLADALERTRAVTQGNPLDTATMVGAQASNDQLEKILSYIDIGEQAHFGGDLAGGYYVQPTIFEGENRMRIFQEEIFGPVVSVTRFADLADAVKIANDTLYGLGAGVWTRDMHAAYYLGRAIQAGRVWTNCYHLYPAHAAFGGYKQSGIGRENHKMMLDHYQQTKNLLVSYSPHKLGFF